ncbi:hypothetical protein ACFFP0_24750 [Rhizobium puerariae]|uniref:Uncharacterized protein n=1 Tax=Rhizobium puerariae TaxID=1585791 RepID=A0ABV6AN74_9HYPH
MADEEEDKLGNLLSHGFEIKAYSTAMMAAGAMVHSILLQKGMDVVTVNIIKTGAKEVGRTVDVFSPPPEKKKGWFS